MEILTGPSKSPFSMACVYLYLASPDTTCRLRCGSVAVVGRIEHERLLLDMRTVADGEIDDVIRAIEAVLQ